MKCSLQIFLCLLVFALILFACNHTLDNAEIGMHTSSYNKLSSSVNILTAEKFNGEWGGAILNKANDHSKNMQDNSAVKLTLDGNTAILTGCVEYTNSLQNLDLPPQTAFSISFDYLVENEILILQNPKYIYYEEQSCTPLFDTISEIRLTYDEKPDYEYESLIKFPYRFMIHSLKPTLMGEIYSEDGNIIANIIICCITKERKGVPVWIDEEYSDEPAFRIFTFYSNKYSGIMSDFTICHNDVKGFEYIRYFEAVVEPYKSIIDCKNGTLILTRMFGGNPINYITDNAYRLYQNTGQFERIPIPATSH